MKYRQSSGFMLCIGILIGMFTFWILDARRASQYLLVRSMDFDKDTIKYQTVHNDHEVGHHEGIEIILILNQCAAAFLLKVVISLILLVFLTQGNALLRITWQRKFVCSYSS